MAETVVTQHGRSEEQREVMEQIKREGVDPFQWDLIEQYHKQPVLKRGTFWLITPNDYPYEGSSLHLLLIYRDTVRYLNEIPAEAFMELHAMLAWIEETYGIGHGAFLMRFGNPQFTGASVHHLHAHIIVGAPEVTDEKLRVSVGYKGKQ